MSLMYGQISSRPGLNPRSRRGTQWKFMVRALGVVSVLILVMLNLEHGRDGVVVSFTFPKSKLGVGVLSKFSRYRPSFTSSLLTSAC